MNNKLISRTITIILVIILLGLTANRFFGVYINKIINPDNVKVGIIELGAYVSNEIDNGKSEIKVYADGVSMDEIQHINEYITCLNGTVKYYTILSKTKDSFELKLEVEISDNYYVYQCYKYGTPIPNDKLSAIELYNKVSAIIDSTISFDMDDYEKEVALHDYLVKNCQYGYPENNDEYGYRAYGALVLDEAVCNGYAEAMALLLKCVDVQATIITGEANDQLHAWNQVNIDGKWYHLDATWNDPVPNKEDFAGHTYFNVSDDIIKNDHTWEGKQNNNCNSMEDNYFVKNNKLYNDYEAFKTGMNSEGYWGEYYQCAFTNYNESEYNLQFIFDRSGIMNISTTLEQFGGYQVMNIFFQ